jgi:dihydroorotate dehydrogenase electron transfer subunit
VTPELVRLTQVERFPRGAATLWFESPVAMRRARPGQFLMLRLSEALDPFLARPYFFARQRLNAAGALEHGLLVEPAGRVGNALAAARAGDTLVVLGPLGRPLELPRGARNLLLAGEKNRAAPLLLIAADAAARGLSVALLLEDEALPVAAGLSSEIELVPVHRGEIATQLRPLLPWCDAAVLSLESSVLAEIGSALRRESHRPAVYACLWQQTPCGVGFCGGCAVELRRGGWRLACADGPILPLAELF